MKLTSLLILLFGSILAEAQNFESFTIANPAIVGRWVSTQPMFTGRDLKVFMAFEFDGTNSTIMQSSVCQYRTKTVEVQTKPVPVNVSTTEIDITASENAALEGSLSCSVNMNKDLYRYQIRGNRLRIRFGATRFWDFNRR